MNIYILDYDYSVTDMSADEVQELFGVPILFSAPKVKGGTKKSWTQIVKDTIREEEICNEKHYQHFLSEDEAFRNAICKLPPTQVESLKKNLFQVVRQGKQAKSYSTKMNTIELKGCDRCKGVLICDNCKNDTEETVAFGTFAQFVSSIASENNLSVKELMENKYGVLEGRKGKVNTLILIGKSDSGKSTFADILLSAFHNYEIGNFKTPIKGSGNTFWLENLPGTDVYRAEECVIEQLDVAQILKSLFEGNPNLEVEVKYKAPIVLPKRPVVVTMNGECREDVTKFISSEFMAFQNRSLIITMTKPLTERLYEGSIGAMKENATYINKVLHDKYGNKANITENEVTIDYCNHFGIHILS